MQDQRVKNQVVTFDFLSESQDGLTGGVEISKGFDRLKFGFYVDFKSDRFFDILAYAKKEAQENRSEIPLQLTMDPDDCYNCHTNGKTGGYNFRLTRADLSIFISTRANWMETPNVYVDIGSASCWSPGYRKVINQVAKLINYYDGKIVKNNVSEVHFCSDFIGLDIDRLGIQRRERWIMRANKFNTYYDCNKFSGISLAQTEGELEIPDNDGNYIETGIVLGQGDIMLRIYDKVFEIKRNKSKHSLFASVWGKQEYDEQPVTRVEYQLRKKVLKQFRIRTLEDLYSKINSVWQYCTCHWSRYCSGPIDKINRHQDRAEIHEFWQAVQSLDWKSQSPAIRQKTIPQKDEHSLADQMVGCAINIAAINRYPADTVDNIRGAVHFAIEEWFRRKGNEINKKTGRPVLLEKMEKTTNDVWPYGYGEIHGYTQRDIEYGFLSESNEIHLHQRSMEN